MSLYDVNFFAENPTKGTSCLFVSIVATLRRLAQSQKPSISNYKLGSGECLPVGLSSALIENLDKPTLAFDQSKRRDLALSLNPSQMLKSVKVDEMSLQFSSNASSFG